MVHHGDTEARRSDCIADLLRLGLVTVVLGVLFGWLIAWLQFETWLITGALAIAFACELMKSADRRLRFIGPLLVMFTMLISIGTMCVIAYLLPGKYLEKQLDQGAKFPRHPITLNEFQEPDPDMFTLAHHVQFNLREQDRGVVVTLPNRPLSYRQVIEVIESQTEYRHRVIAKCANGWPVRWGHDSGYEFRFTHRDHHVNEE